MKVSRLAFTWVLCLLALLVGCRKEPGRSDDAGTSVADSSDGPVFAPGQLSKHFAKHGGEVGARSEGEYLAKARALVKGGPGTETLTQADGDRCTFRDATGEFGVVSPRGVLRTYFIPREGRGYFERQRSR